MEKTITEILDEIFKEDFEVSLRPGNFPDDIIVRVAYYPGKGSRGREYGVEMPVQYDGDDKQKKVVWALERCLFRVKENVESLGLPR